MHSVQYSASRPLDAADACERCLGNYCSLQAPPAMSHSAAHHPAWWGSESALPIDVSPLRESCPHPCGAKPTTPELCICPYD
jgi:hypothetical protein